MKRTILAVCSVAGFALATAVTVGYHADDIKAADNGYCMHNGYHYNHKGGTESVHGYQEYWVCCKCHEHWTYDPGNGYFPRNSHDPKIEEVPTNFYIHNYKFKDDTIGDLYCTIPGCEAHRRYMHGDIVLSEFKETMDAEYVAGEEEAPEWTEFLPNGSLAWSLEDVIPYQPRPFFAPAINFDEVNSIQLSFRTKLEWNEKICLAIPNKGDIVKMGHYPHILVEINKGENDNIHIAAQPVDHPEVRITQDIPLTLLDEGRIPFQFTYDGEDVRVGLDAIRVNHEHSFYDNAPSKQRIGYYALVCHECGEHTERKAYPVMGNDDIEILKYTYGATAWNKPQYGAGIARVVNGRISGKDYFYYYFQRYEYENRFGATLPKIAYNLYSDVQLNFSVLNGQGAKYGWNYDHIFLLANENDTLGFHIRKENGAYLATIEYPYSGYNQTITITDKEVLDGEKGLEFAVQNHFVDVREYKLAWLSYNFVKTN